MIQFNDIDNVFATNVELDFNDTSHYLNTILNGTVHFKDPFTNQFSIGQNNTGINKALPSASLNFPLDILGINRTTNPDIGAYQHATFQ
jgi:hypothetical protein